MSDDDWPESLPQEVRRQWWGWWGEPWPSGICETDDKPGVWNWAMNVPVPVGSPCMWCEESIGESDQGSNMPYMGEGKSTVVHIHRECSLRQVMGSYKHLTGGPHATGDCHDPSISAREDALLVWNYFRQGGS